MKVIHKHNIYLDKRQSNIYIDVMQADAYTRVLEFSLYSGGQAWNVPEGVDVAVAYIGSSGKGIYDTLPDGTEACTVNGNVVTAVVAPQAVAMDGNTNLNIIFTDDAGHQLAAFCVTLKVERNPAVNATKPPDYINLRQWLSKEIRELLTYYVHVEPDGDGGYFTDSVMDDVLQACASDAPVICRLELPMEPDNLQLPLSKYDDSTAYFSTVFEGKEYLVTITADGVTVEISECGGGNSGGNVGGLTTSEKQLMLTLFKNMLSEANLSSTVAKLESIWFGGEDVEPDVPEDPDEPVYCAIQYNLTNVASTNAETSVVKGGEFTTTLTAVEGYKINKVAVIMDGIDITETAYSDNVITITNISGDIVITASASNNVDSGTAWESGVPYTITTEKGKYVSETTGELISQADYYHTDYIPCYGVWKIKYVDDGLGMYGAFYDATQKYITGFRTAGGIAGEKHYITIPEQAAYVRVSSQNDLSSSTVMTPLVQIEPTWEDGVAYTLTPFVENEYVSVNEGTFIAYDGWKRTEYINCAKAAKLVSNKAIQYGALYDLQKDYIGGLTLEADKDAIIPETAAYFVASGANSVMDELVVTPYKEG